MFSNLDKLFRRPFLAVAFSGFGIPVLGLIIKIIVKKFKKDNTHINTNTLTNKTISPINEDIKHIQRSINYDLSDQQEQTFLYYYNKYKKRLDSNDSKNLYDEYKKIHSKILPNYSALLSSLAGLIESIDS